MTHVTCNDCHDLYCHWCSTWDMLYCYIVHPCITDFVTSPKVFCETQNKFKVLRYSQLQYPLKWLHTLNQGNYQPDDKLISWKIIYHKLKHSAIILHSFQDKHSPVRSERVHQNVHNIGIMPVSFSFIFHGWHGEWNIHYKH